MKLSISVANHSWPGGPEVIGPHVARIVRAADQSGIDTLWAMDHMFQIPLNGPVTDPLLESYSLLGFVAGHTDRIRLGALVTGVSYRPAGLLVKAVTSLDVLSQGRAWLGIGAAWDENEARAYHLPFPPRPQRYELLEETLQLAHQMWSGNAEPFHGKHLHLEQPFLNPTSVQRPHPPILIGGSGERKTLRLVARYADACNLFDVPEGVEIAGIVGGLDGLRHKLDVLRSHCDDVGRPYDAIEKTITSTFALRPDRHDAKGRDEVLDHFAALAGAGLEHVVFEPNHTWDDGSLELIASIVPDLAALS
jgi:F420-dependent oxidoreductase-like protein